MSHFVEFDRIQAHGMSIAVCGAYVNEPQISCEPTCPECQRLEARTAEELFGAPVNTPVVQSPGYHDDFFDFAVTLTRDYAKKLTKH